MSVRVNLAAVAILAIFFVGGLVRVSQADTFIDDFNVNHTYWEGAVPVSNGSEIPFNVPALYVDMTGDFDAKLRMDVLPPDIGYLTLALAAWTADQQKALHIDNIAVTGNHVRFRDADPTNYDEFSLGIARQPWFRLKRTGNIFQGFYGTDGVNWTTIGSMERDYGETLRVGPATWNFWPEEYTGSFSYFEISGVGSDDFNTDHVYWDGNTVDVSGTMWSGLQGEGTFVAEANANIGAAGELQITHAATGVFSPDVSGTIWTGAQGEGLTDKIDANVSVAGELQISHPQVSSDGSAPPFDVPALFMDVTGDFDAKLRMDILPADSPSPPIKPLTVSLAAWTADQENAIHVDNVGSEDIDTHVRFRDLELGDEFALEIDRQTWLRLRRNGNIFTGYYGSDGENWTLIGSIEGDYDDTLQVGPAAWSGAFAEFTGSFSYFEIAIGDIVDIPGDTNLDGVVDDQDASILASHWQQQSGATWAMGDFNGDYAVNDIDATIMAANWQVGVSASVPEPGIFTLLIGVLLGCLTYKRRVA